MSLAFINRLLFSLFFLGGFSVFWANFIAQKRLDHSKVALLAKESERVFVRRWPGAGDVLPDAKIWIVWRKVFVGLIITVVVLMFLMPDHHL
jgi:hypothetical protein